LPIRPQPQRVLLVAVQRIGVDRALDDAHVRVRVKQLADPVEATVEDCGCLAASPTGAWMDWMDTRIPLWLFGQTSADHGA
jgi:hypothetical protein